MARTHSFPFPLIHGLHARPASHLAEFVATFVSRVTLFNERTGRSADARSVLALVGTDTRHTDPCRLTVAGPDEEMAGEALTAYLAGAFLRCDETMPESSHGAASSTVPRSLLAAGVGSPHLGAIACRGLGQGILVTVRASAPPSAMPTEPAKSPEEERTRLATALASVQTSYDRQILVSRGAAADVLKAHRSLLNDPSLNEEVKKKIDSGASARQAVQAAIAHHSARLAEAESVYLRERVLDLEDIAERLAAALSGSSAETPMVPMAVPSIVVAERLTPGRFLALDRLQLRGLVLGHAGQTSHTVILARSFGIPTLTGVKVDALWAHAGRPSILDARAGVLVVDPTPGVSAYFVGEFRHAAALERIAASAIGRVGMTKDGRRLEVAANIASAPEAALAFARGAEGIGLFRTELLFMDRPGPPSEEEQYEQYATVVRAAAGRPVIIRTLDIGGDKPVPFLGLPTETNPFLGYRGVRLYDEFRDLLAIQFRALWRAARHGPLKVLIPMVATVEEARAVRALQRSTGEAMRAEGTSCGESMPLGLMLEVPSAAYQIFELCEEAEFFSLGTNDLAQYFFAADRENHKVSDRYGPLHPAFLRLLRHLIAAAHARGRWIGLCGEMAENAAALPLLVGLELDEISLAAPRIAATKAALADLSFRVCVGRTERALQASTREAVLATLAEERGTLPMLTGELVVNLAEPCSKEGVIHAMVQALQLAGRAQDPNAIENAIWRREDTHPTDFGDGFAVPHCQTDHVTANSIVIARLHSPVEWQSPDGQPVGVAILLVIRSDDQDRAHLKCLARLSRLVMQEPFREGVRAQSDPAIVADYVLAQIGEGPLGGSAAEESPDVKDERGK